MTNSNNTNQSVYIQSLEASDIYLHNVRGGKIKPSYVGMIPYSLELIKLQKTGLKVFTKHPNPKLLSDDIINVKFNQKVNSGSEIINIYSDKIEEMVSLDSPLLEHEVSYLHYLEDSVQVIREEIEDEKWNEVSNFNLRYYLYASGFYVNNVKYVVYKRSSSKSRTGQCLFIREELRDEMIKWSRMGLDITEGSKIDYPSLLAYESLVGSSIINTIEIDPANVLIVDDVISKFNQIANVIRANDDTGYLDSYTEETEIVNDLFDGQSLLQSDYFPEDESMMLLRNHMFKSAAFNTNIQKFLKDNCPNHIDYDNWKITNMFGQEMFAKDVHMITTPNSLKALKFNYLLGDDIDMWEHWKTVVIDENNVFGVCQYEDESSRGRDEEGSVLQQTSYQMLNSLPLDKTEISKLAEYEKNYIDKMKNNDDFFIEHIKSKANEVNGNMMLVELYNINKDIINTKLFRDFKSAEINRHVTHVKRGKVRLKGDYCVMLGNGYEMLLHAIGKFDVVSSELSLKGNQIYTKLFEFDKELVGFRNPHTSPSNTLLAKNTYNKNIEKYFNLSDNIVVVNAVRFAIQDTLSGCDYDSDTVVLFDSETLLRKAKGVSEYHVCINHVESEKREYRLNHTDMAIIDNTLSQSQKFIGRVVNLGQEIMSAYWDSGAINERLMRQVDVMTVLSGISIDMAKQLYDLNIAKEIQYVEKKASLGNHKPEFFKYISQSNTIRDRVKRFNTAMDYLQIEMDSLPAADYKRYIEFNDLLVKHDKNRRNRRQQKNIINYVEEMADKINYINMTSTDRDEKFELLDNAIKYCEFYIRKMKVNSNTMYALVDSVTGNNNRIATRLLTVLYETQKDAFLSAFKRKN